MIEWKQMTKEYPIRTGVGSLSILGPISCDQEADGNKAMSSAATPEPPWWGTSLAVMMVTSGEDRRRLLCCPKQYLRIQNQAAQIIEPY